MRRQYPVMQSQRGLDQPRRARRAFGVPDQSLDRPHRATGRSRFRFRQQGGESFQFRPVAGHRARAVRFPTAHRRRRIARFFIRPAQGPQLTFRARGGQALGAAIAGTAHTPDDRVDPITIPLGIGQTLERHRRQAFGNHDAVRLFVEGLAATARRQGLGLGETEIHERRLHHVDAAGQRQIALAQPEFVRGLIDRRQRRSAGGVHRAVDPAEIEAVGHPSGGHVEQQAGEGILGPLRQARPRFPARIADDAGQCRPHGVIQGKIARPTRRAQQHRHPLPIQLRRIEPGVVESLADQFQRQQLQGIDRLERHRRHPIATGIKSDLTDETAPARINPVGRLRVGIVIQPPVPAFGRNFADAVHAVEDIGPIGAQLVSARQQHAHPDNRDSGGIRRGPRRLPSVHERSVQPAGAESPLASANMACRICSIRSNSLRVSVRVASIQSARCRSCWQ